MKTKEMDQSRFNKASPGQVHKAHPEHSVFPYPHFLMEVHSKMKSVELKNEPHDVLIPSYKPILSSRDTVTLVADQATAR